MMGWLWSSSQGPGEDSRSPPSNEPASTPRSSRVALTDEQRLRIFGKTGPAASPTQSREQQADSELEALIKSWEASEGGDTTASAKTIDSSTAKAAVEEKTNNDRILPDGSLDISPEVIYPRTMSCRQQFDQAFYCQSLGGKFNDIYRYGHLRSCSEQWGAFWFCMRTRTLPEKEKAEQIKEFYASREKRKKEEFGSSEDIWEIRKTAVTRAFGKDPYAADDERRAQVEE